MGLSSLVSRIVPAAVGYVTGGPVGAFTAAAATESAKRQERTVKRKIAQQQEQENRIRSELMAMGSGEFGTPGISFTPPPPQQVGFFDRLSQFGSNLGSTVLTGLESALPSVITGKILGQRPPSVAQQPALTTITNVGAQESQASGSIQAGLGGLLPTVLGGARSLLKSPAGQLALGGGALALGSLADGQGRQMRITRKMKSQARMVLNMTGGNLAAAADMLGIDQNTLVMILLKRFRNDGPVVTKAALRKTKSTIRKLHNMQDVLKSITPTAAGRRRAPMKRATTTTLIKN